MAEGSLNSLTVRVDSPAPLGKVQNGLNNIHAEVSHLDEVLTEFIDRIGPVLTPDYGEEADDSVKPPKDEGYSPDSDVVQSLDSAASKLMRLRFHLAETLRRVEL
jgi:hypothetical protein